MTGKDELLTQAIVVWIGWGQTRWPQRDESRVISTLGEEVALDLLPRVRALEEDFFRSTAWRDAPSLAAMGKRAASEFRSRHPEIGEEAVRALSWSYTYDQR